jgi:fluoride ion exporter CrcB/FEX
MVRFLVMGGYTTYSSYETLTLVEQGSWEIAGLYLGLTVLGCLTASFLGLTAARALARARGVRP